MCDSIIQQAHGTNDGRLWAHRVCVINISAATAQASSLEDAAMIPEEGEMWF
jgi:hypothetical protein